MSSKSKKLRAFASSRETKKEEAKPALVPKLRFPEFREAEGWEQKTGDRLFDQINERNPQPGLPVLAITQEHGAIPRHMIDCVRAREFIPGAGTALASLFPVPAAAAAEVEAVHA